MRYIVWLVMDRACEWSGHRLFCYNRPRWANRLWGWAWDFDKYPAAPSKSGGSGGEAR